jgi:hypothetical protein
MFMILFFNKTIFQRKQFCQTQIGYPGKKVKKILQKKPDRQMFVSLKRSDLAVSFIAKLHSLRARISK